ncbi:MAG: DNA mismatch repair endonuclease MutL [bacterium]
MSEAGRIRRLPRDVIEKIAAGEVIERPASVVKELVENALDAGATEIVVSIDRGADLRIAVADDGLGMVPDDARLAFERHATSKVGAQSDLDAVVTLGFRGEALAAIAAVSEAEIVSAPAHAGATRVRMRGGELVATEAAARARGTTVTVSNLFFNTPARRKFLKRDATEVRAIEREVIAHAFAAEGVGFTFIENGETRFRLTAQISVATRMDTLFGGGLGDELLAIGGEAGDASVSGFISPPRRSRGIADGIYLAVNGRPIESRALQRAILQGYEPLLASRRYPLAAVMLRIPFAQVDPNVHPTKREVRFVAEQDLFRLVRRSVARALNGAGLVPDFSAPIQALAQGGEPAPAERLPFARESGASWSSWNEPPARGAAPDSLRDADAARADATSALEVADGASGRAVLESLLAAPAILQAHRTYLVAESVEGLLLVDQHTAHERILFEEGLARIAAKSPARQPLLVPATLSLAPADARRLEEHADALAALGFDLRAIGPDTFLVEAVPMERRGEDIGRWIGEIVENLARDSSPQDRLVRAARSYACKTAVRAGDTLRPAEIRSLLTRLARAENPFACPHGRPVVARVRLRDIERLFGRR